MFPKQLSSYIEKERRFRHLCVAKCLLRKSLTAYSAGTLPMYSSGSGKHPHLEECPVRDYFSETDASLLGEIHRWGLFFRAESISAQKNPPSGIISPRRMHPCSEKSTVWDYFSELKASLLGEILRWGLFFQGGIIPARRNPPPGIIFPRRMHPCSKNCSPRDYFPEADASPRGRQAITG